MTILNDPITDIFELFTGVGKIDVATKLIKLWGGDAAILLALLPTHERDLIANNVQMEDGFIEFPVKLVEDWVGLTEYAQRSALKKLEEAGVVEVKRMGIPAKRYIRYSMTKAFNGGDLDE